MEINMSDEFKVDPNVIKKSAQPLESVVIGVEDIKNVETFLSHFKIVPDAGLEAALNNLQAVKNGTEEITLETQETLKKAIVFFLSETDHPLLQDELFAPLKKQVDALAQEIAFNDIIVSEIEGETSE